MRSCSTRPHVWNCLSYFINREELHQSHLTQLKHVCICLCVYVCGRDHMVKYTFLKYVSSFLSAQPYLTVGLSIMVHVNLMDHMDVSQVYQNF